MSRSRKGDKGCGFEYWGKRPGTKKTGGSPGKFSKKYTHRLERIEGKKESENSLMEYCPMCDADYADLTNHYCDNCDCYICEFECSCK